MNHKTLTGREVIAIDSGRKLGHIERILFDPATMRIDSLVVHSDSRSMLEESTPMQQIPVSAIRRVGEDVVMVEHDDALQPIQEGGATAGNLIAFDQIENEAVLTESGKKIGEVADIEFDDRTLELQSIQLSRGLFSRNSSLAVSEIISVGEDAIVVRDTVDLDSQDQAEEPESGEDLGRVRVISDPEVRDESEK
jgi:sporulation protein YlmC with PRC-barrel domain